MCFLPIHSGLQWTYQPGSHRKKVTQDFPSTFFLRCYIGIPIQVKNKINEEEAIPPPYEAGECSSSGSRRPGHPHSTPWSCERAKTKLTTHVMQDSIPYVLDSISTRHYYAGELFVGFLTNQDCMNRSLSPRYLTYAYCQSNLDFLLRVG